MKEARLKIVKHWLKVFFGTLLVVFIVRCFFIEPYTISSTEMETSLYAGDRIMVNKTAYGIRMPMTPLTIPFTFDQIFGRKSYSTALEFPYKRLFAKRVSSNDVVLFNNPHEKDKPIDKRGLFVSRCVGLPGDSIQVNGLNFSIKGKEYVSSPNLLLKYTFPADSVLSLEKILTKLSIPKRLETIDSTTIYLALNRFEAYMLDTEWEGGLNVVEGDLMSYQIFIPYAGMKVQLTAENYPLYASIIADELGQSVESVDFEKIKTYQFQYDYYWLLSDNVADALDSRYVGFISERDIVGKASFVWWSSGIDGVRLSRIFKGVY